jgi:membrane associated rhomboid family serine protease
MSEQHKQRSEESLRHEYNEVALNARHYSTLRFAVYTILFVVMGGVGFVAFGKGQFDAHTAQVARIAGFPIIGIFWWYEERVRQLLDHSSSVAMELERALGYTQYTTRPDHPWPYLRKAKVVGRLLYCSLTLLWLYAVFAVPLGS